MVFVSISSLGRSGIGILVGLGGRSVIGNSLGWVRWVIIRHCKVEDTSCYYSSYKMVTNYYVLV